MKSVLAAVLAALGLGGCIAVPAPYYPDTGYHYSAPAVGVGIYSGPGYHRHHYHHRHHRHRW